MDIQDLMQKAKDGTLSTKERDEFLHLMGAGFKELRTNRPKEYLDFLTQLTLIVKRLKYQLQNPV